MAHPLWSGSISFGLINIPVRLYSASVEREFNFQLLHKKDLSPISYARVCRAEGKEVPYEDVVKGYEYRKGDYVILHDEDFEKVDLKRTKSIDISSFTDESEIDPIYLEKPYYIEPDERAVKAYLILREALRVSHKVGVASYVLHNKEHLGILKVEGDVLVLDQLRYKEELKKPGLKVPKGKTSKREIDMALKLINQLTEHFHPEKYHDAYSDELKKVIAKKAHGKPVKAKGKEPKPTKVPDIMSVLRKSLEKEQKSHARK
ncbi:MAG: Ku protein [Patescibacteria group bacterium]